MKKLILFLLFPLLSFGQTYSSVSALIDNNLSSGSKITAVKHREVEHAILDYLQLNISQSGDIKRVKCDITYLNDNFEVDGLGKNLRAGWAICNGNNGTDNLAGRVGVGYGIGYSSLGGIGGVASNVLTTSNIPQLTAIVNKSVNTSGGSGNNLVGNVSNNAGNQSIIVNSGSSNTAVNNMQPYIIQLYIMKL